MVNTGVNEFPIEEIDSAFEKSKEVEYAINILAKAFDLGRISEEQYLESLEKARKYQIGEISQTTGLKKVKEGVWVDPNTGKQVKSDEESKSKESKVEGSKKEYSEDELREFAKKSSLVDLERQIKESSDENVRKIANEEVARRSKEEVVGEREDGGKEESLNFPIVEKKYDGGSTVIVIGDDSGSRVRGKLSKDGKIFKISSTFVAENERGRGVATKMYIQLLEDLKGRGVEIVQSDVQVEEAAGKIYSKLEKEGYVINKNKDATLEVEDGGNFWWVQSDDSKSPFEIELNNTTKQLGKIHHKIFHKKK